MGKMHCPVCGHTNVEKIGENNYKCKCSECKCDVTWQLLLKKIA